MDQPSTHDRVRDRPPAARHRSLRSLTPLADVPRPSWHDIADSLSAESNLRERGLRRALSLADCVALAIALATTLIGWSLHPNYWKALLMFPAIVAAAKTLGLYESDDQRIRKTTVDELPQLAQLGALLVIGFWLADGPLINRPVEKVQDLVFGLVFVVTAVLGRRVARRLANRNHPRERCLFAGDEESFARLARIFERHELSSDLAARVPVEQAMIDGDDVQRDAQALIEVIARAGAHRLIIGPNSFSNTMTFALLEAAREAGTRVSLLPDMLEVVGSSVDFDDLYGVTLLGVRHTQLSRSSAILKRSFDLAGALPLLILSAPLMAIIAIAIKRDSPGPVLFRQKRIGRNGEPFHILKFRTMVDGADRLKNDLRDRNEADGLFKIGADPRITPIGRKLRPMSLDELPQIFNVLFGQMSLVGPRPLVADEDRSIESLQRGRGRLRLTPGMTGQWQIAGSSRVPMEDMVKLDHLYVSNWTVWGDVKILLRTVPYVLSRRGQ